MQKYANSVQDTAGNAIEAASVYVYDQGTANLSTIYSDNGSTVTTNPQTTNSLGEFSFYAADGRYDIKVSKTGITTQNLLDIILYDPAASSGAAGVGFLQSGSGAVATDVQTELRARSLNAQTFAGADPTGVTEAATQIQDALTAGAGKAVYLPKGTYKVSTTLLVSSGTQFYGDGFATVIQWAGGNTNVVQNKNYDNSQIGVNVATADTDIEVNHIKVICTGTTSGSSNRGIAFANVIRGSIHNNYVTNPGNCGIMVAPGRDINVYANNVTGGNATSGNNGITVDNSSNRVTVSENIVSSVYDSGIGIHNSSVDVTVTGNVIDTTTIGHGIDVAGPQKTTVTGNSVRSVAGVGIYVHDQTSISAGYVATEITVTGNEVVSAGSHGIQVFDASAGNVKNVTVTGNVIKTPTSDGVNLSRGVKGVTVTGNIIDTPVNGIYLTQSNPNYPNGCIVSSNVVISATVGIKLDALSIGNVVGLNQLVSCTTDISVSATAFQGYSANVFVGNSAANGGVSGMLSQQGPFIFKRTSPTYGVSVAIDLTTGNQFDITATNGTAFTIANPTNDNSLFDGDEIVITIKNTSGGALGTITWGTGYKMSTWTSPATGFSRSIRFKYEYPSIWREISVTAADVPN